MGFNLRGGENNYSVRSVERELIHGSMPQLRFQLSEEKGALSVKQPSKHARDTIAQAAARVGEKGVLSEADREIVALAMDLKLSGLNPVIVSDDYAVQNLAEHLQLEYGGLANFGIVRRFQWTMYCPACHRRYGQTVKECKVCGTLLRRIVLSKTRIRRAAEGRM